MATATASSSSAGESYQSINQTLREAHLARLSRNQAGVQKLFTFAAVADAGVRIVERPGLEIGTIVWSGAELLCEYMAETFGANGLAGVHIVELGSGTGLAGIFAAALGAHVVLTDLENHAATLRENAQLNSEVIARAGGSVTVETLAWSAEAAGSFLQHGEQGQRQVNMIIGADIVYVQHDEDSLRNLVDTIEVLLAYPGSSPKLPFLLSYRQRAVGEEGFFKAIEDKQYSVQQKITRVLDTVYSIAPR
jgi:hypothetical protein